MKTALISGSMFRVSHQPAVEVNSFHIRDGVGRRIHDSGSPTTIASVVARDSATWSRFLSRTKLNPRGPASPKLEHIERMTTAACWPWNLSTDPMRFVWSALFGVGTTGYLA